MSDQTHLSVIPNGDLIPQNANDEGEAAKDDQNARSIDQITLKQDENVQMEVASIQADQNQLKVIGKLENEANEFRKLWLNFNADFNGSESSIYYLMSCNWMRTWKRHVGYAEGSQTFEPDFSCFARFEKELVSANSDLILAGKLPNSYFPASALDTSQGFDILLKQDLKEEADYIIVDEKIVSFFKSKYPMRFTKIPRRAYRDTSGTKRCLRDIESNFLKALYAKKLQVFSQESQGQFKQDLVPIVKEFQHESNSRSSYNGFIKAKTIRLWKLESESSTTTLSSLHHSLQKSTKQFKGFDYNLRSPFPLIERADENTVIHDIGLDSDGATLIIEVQKQNGGWLFKQEGDPSEESCEYCRVYKVLTVECRCKGVQYCSEQCKMNDLKFHRTKCHLAGIDPDDETPEPYVITKGSVRGLCGLKNLGNTCFLNSALQCLSHTIPLTKYFLEKKFKGEINYKNVLGTKGKLVSAYANFIKNVWIGKAGVFSPCQLKSAIASVQGMFAGYQQHDSQEFLSFLIDQIHEDVNRVMLKAITKPVESEGRSDEEVSRESWENHLKRNRSVIVDLMNGLFRSKVTCPSCRKQSITFDPFLTCSLPIPTIQAKRISAFFISAYNKQLPQEVTFAFDPSEKLTVRDFKDYIARKYAINADHLELFRLTQQIFYYFVSGLGFRVDLQQIFNLRLIRLQDIKQRYKDNDDLESLRQYLKEEKTKAILIEQPIEVALKEERNIVEILVKFSRWVEEGKRIKNKVFTFVRPILLHETTQMKEVYLEIFKYVQSILTQKLAADSNFVLDSKKLTQEEMLIKYVISAEEKPFWVYPDMPTAATGEEKSEAWVELQLQESITIGEMQKAARDSILRMNVVINDKNEIGKACMNLHSLVKGEGSQISQVSTDESEVSIYDCLQLFSKPEKLGEDNTWYCSTCKKHQRAIKEMKVYCAPEILIFHLKRFKGTGVSRSKLTKIVRFPLKGLDMSDFVVKSQFPSGVEEQQPKEINQSSSRSSKEEINQLEQENQQEDNSNGVEDEENEEVEKEEEIKQISSNNQIYDLFAVTNHFGGLGGGHYTAFAKNDDRWRVFDDSFVGLVAESDVVSHASYILFYMRRPS